MEYELSFYFMVLGFLPLQVFDRGYGAKGERERGKDVLQTKAYRFAVPLSHMVSTEFEFYRRPYRSVILNWWVGTQI